MAEETVPSGGSPSELPYSEPFWVWAVRGKRPLVALQHRASVQGCKGEGDLFPRVAEEEQGVRVSGFS